jgi:hypothetical protein
VLHGLIPPDLYSIFVPDQNDQEEVVDDEQDRGILQPEHDMAGGDQLEGQPEEHAFDDADEREVRRRERLAQVVQQCRRLLRKSRITARRVEVPGFVCLRERAMKDVWCLVSSRSEWTGTEMKRSYGKRFSVEESFRDLKNPRLGLGLKQTVITRNDRRDKLFLLAVQAHTLLTLLGKAGQELGMERWLGATKPGGISLFRQGLLLWDLLPRMREDRLRALMTRYGELLRQHVLFTGILGVL